MSHPFPRCDEWKDSKTTSLKPGIGLYIALASLACFVAVAADTFHGIRSKKLWFPCRYFGLNAASLTLLAVASKLTGDVDTQLKGYQEQVAKLGGIAFVANALAHFMASLASMDNYEIFANVLGLGIFVVSLIVNLWLFFFSNYVADKLEPQYVSGTCFLLLLFVTLVSCSVSVPTAKVYIETRYHERHQQALEEEARKTGKQSIKNLKLMIKKFWVMAATGDPEFVMARSVLSVTTGSLCILSFISFVVAEILTFLYIHCPDFYSEYKWSTKVILPTQWLAVVAGIIPPICRWFFVVSLKFSKVGWDWESCKNELKIETFWIKRLEEWRGSSIRSIRCRKLVHGTRYLILSLCIKLQILVVLSSKLLLLFSVFSLSPFRYFLKHKSESCSQTEQDLSGYVLLLEGEDALPKKTLRNIIREADRLILKGEKKKPKNLPKLLCGFNNGGVADLENDQIPSLQSLEPPGCWTLPIVILTRIALALPNIEDHNVDDLLRSVSEGLPYANLVQKLNDTNRTAKQIRKAAKSLWIEVELKGKRLDQKLNNSEGRTSREVLQGLAKEAEEHVKKFKNENKGQIENPIYWPDKVVKANSMYRISKAILLNFEEGNQIADKQLFKKLSDTIADIFAACFTNLPGVITLKCQCDAIEKRVSSVQQAALLLGQTEEILEVVEQCQKSGIIPNRVASFDDWRVSVRQRNANAMAFDSASGLEVVISSN